MPLETSVTAAMETNRHALRYALQTVLQSRQTIGLGLLALGGAVLVVGYGEALHHAGLKDEHLLIALAIFVAAMTSGIAGFAFSGICGAMLFHLMNGPVDIVRVMMACSIANQMMGVWAVRRALHWPSLRPFLVGGLFGVPVGVFLLTDANPMVYEKTIGVLLVGYCTYMLFRKPIVVRNTSPTGDVLVGAASGLLGGFAGFPGAPTAIRCAMKGWDKDRQRALYQPLILLLQVLALGLIELWSPARHAGAGLGVSALAYLPGSLLGTWWGLTFFKRLNDRQFAVAVNVLLIVSGVTLVV